MADITCHAGGNGPLKMARRQIAVYWLYRVGVNWAVVVAAMGLALWSWWLVPVAWFAIATRQHALSILGHDGAHGHICARSWWNDALANVFCLWPINADVRSYRTMHFAHHRLLGTAADPERDLHALSSDPRRARRFMLDMLGGGLREVIAAAATVRPSPAVYVGNAVMALLFVAMGAWLVPVLWWVSLATAYWAIFRLRVYTEHVGAPGGTHRQKRPPLWQRLVYLPELTWLHWEHHRSPGTPLLALSSDVDIEYGAACPRCAYVTWYWGTQPRVCASCGASSMPAEK